jgi:hypothetical protein
MLKVLKEINSDADVYQAVTEVEIKYVEAQLAFNLPLAYREILINPDVELAAKLGLLWVFANDNLGILEVNARLHGWQSNPYPEDLIAFATFDCGDYFCFRKSSGEIVYIDPSFPIEENLQGSSFVLQSFDAWLDYRKDLWIKGKSKL